MIQTSKGFVKLLRKKTEIRITELILDTRFYFLSSFISLIVYNNSIIVCCLPRRKRIRKNCPKSDALSTNISGVWPIIGVDNRLKTRNVRTIIGWVSTPHHKLQTSQDQNGRFIQDYMKYKMKKGKKMRKNQSYYAHL